MFQKMLSVGGSGSTTLYQFSEIEQKLNAKWLNGKDVYQVVVNIGTVTSGTGAIKDISYLNIDSIIEVYYGCSQGNAEFYSVGGGHDYSSHFYINNNSINKEIGSGQSLEGVFAIITYTKK